MGLFQRFGDWATKMWGRIIGRPEPITAAVEIAAAAGVTVEPYDLVREYRHVIAKGQREKDIANVGLEQTIPHSLYQESLVPTKKPFSYEVMLSGRHLKTGMYRRFGYKVQFSEEATVAEIETRALALFAATGDYASMDVTHVGVTAAFTRGGEDVWAFY